MATGLCQHVVREEGMEALTAESLLISLSMINLLWRWLWSVLLVSQAVLLPLLFRFVVSLIFLVKNDIGCCNNNKWFNSISNAVSGCFPQSRSSSAANIQHLSSLEALLSRFHEVLLHHDVVKIVLYESWTARKLNNTLLEYHDALCQIYFYRRCFNQNTKPPFWSQSEETRQAQRPITMFLHLICNEVVPALSCLFGLLTKCLIMVHETWRHNYS